MQPEGIFYICHVMRTQIDFPHLGKMLVCLCRKKYHVTLVRRIIMRKTAVLDRRHRFTVAAEHHLYSPSIHDSLSPGNIFCLKYSNKSIPNICIQPTTIMKIIKQTELIALGNLTVVQQCSILLKLVFKIQNPNMQLKFGTKLYRKILTVNQYFFELTTVNSLFIQNIFSVLVQRQLTYRNLCLYLSGPNYFCSLHNQPKMIV